MCARARARDSPYVVIFPSDLIGLALFWYLRSVNMTKISEFLVLIYMCLYCAHILFHV